MRRDRRTFIRTVGVGSVAAFGAGCSALSSDDGTETGTPATATEGESGGETDGGGDVPRVITIEGGGADIWNETDLGHFFYEEVSGDFDVRVQVASLGNTNPYAKAGIMVRESLEPQSRNVMIREMPGSGLSTQWRPANAEGTTSTTSEDGASLSEVDGGTMEATWQRLEREGDVFRAYGSTDGEEWTRMVELTASEIELSEDVPVGLAVTSHNQAEATTAKLRNLSGLSPSENQDLGMPLVEGSVSVDETALASLGEAADVTDAAATLRGSVEHMGGFESVDVGFEYREVTASEWTESDSQSVSETGEFSVEVSGLTGRRYYQYRAVVDDGENVVRTVGELFATTSGADGEGGDGPRSASQFDPDDGFADLAPWLDDDTPLVVVSEPTRDALETATAVDGPRVVVFETSGTIDLGAQDLNVRNDECWIAGQTAPSPGITLTRGGLWVYGNDCVVQHLRVRPGDAGEDEGWQPDGIEVADDAQNNVVDHCTGTWGVDENVNAGYDTTDTTISNCLIAEPLNDATHEKGEHGYNTIIGDRATNVTLVGNVWALATDRNPRLKQGTETVVANNLIYHHHDGMWADPETAHSIVGNVFEAPQTDQPNVYGEGSVYAEDNVQGDDADVAMVGDDVTELDSRPQWPDALEAIGSGDVREHNLANAGARPADRTEHDERIVAAVRDGEGEVIDSQDDVGGYPELAENTAAVEEPQSGLRAWLREQALAVEE